MADTKKETLQDRKEALEAELKGIQSELDDSLDKVKSDVSSSLEPRAVIRRHPLPMVGLSLLAGFLVGKKTRRGDGESPESELMATLWYELKRLATRKGISLATEYVEQIITGEHEED